MKQRYFLLLLTVLMVGCVCAGCFVQQPGTSQLAEMPNVTTIPNTVPASSMSPAATIATTAPADHPFDPKEYAAQISESLEREMRQALADQEFWHDPSEAENAVFRRVFGIFGDTYVLFIDGYEYMSVNTEDTVNGLKFCYSSGQQLKVFTDGRFYKLQEAFDAQVISESELAIVYENYYSAYPYLLEE